MARQTKTPRPPRSNTRARIIEHSILLFNRHGVSEVSIEQITSDLKISRGNLNYHFKLKRDLIVTTLEVLDERLRSALQPPKEALSPTGSAQYDIRLMHTLWDFRFLFNGLAYLLRHYSSVRKRYFELRDWVLDSIENSIVTSAERGIFLPATAPNTYRLLTENIWGMWLNWLRMTQIENPLARTPEKKALHDGVIHFWSLCQPWLEPRYAQQLLEAFEKELQVRPEATDARQPRERTKTKRRDAARA